MAALSAEFGDDLAILAFPTGEFGGQELPTDDAIAKLEAEAKATDELCEAETAEWHSKRPLGRLQPH